MNKVDELARKKAQVFLLQSTGDLLKEYVDAELVKLSNEERMQYENKVLAWFEQEDMAKSADRTIGEIWNAVKNIQIPGDEVMLFYNFDKSGEMTIKIHISGNVLEVDVLKSIKARSSNFEHPLIQWAIKRAAIHASNKGNPASKFLAKLPSTVREGISDPGVLRPYKQITDLRRADPDYCVVAWRAICDLGLYDYIPGEARRLHPSMIEALKEKLDESLPGKDHGKMIEFLSEGRLPKDKRLPAFVAAFNAFLYNKVMSIASYTQTVYRVNKEIKDAGGSLSFSAEQLNPESFTDDVLSDYLWGRRVIATVEQITKTGLCYRELSTEELLVRTQEIEANLQDEEEDGGTTTLNSKTPKNC